MKKTLFILLTLSTLTISSCVAQNLSKSIENSLGEKVYLKISGKLYLKQSSENTILILCRSNGISPQYFDKAFVVLSETAIPKISINETDDYEIQIPESKKYCVIYNITKNKIHFIGTSDKADDIRQIKQNSSISKSVTNSDYLGFGFSYLNAMWTASDIKASQYKIPFNTLDFANSQNTQLRAALPPVEDEPGGVSCAIGTCTSGGAGSSSCSITEAPFGQSCTVTCNSGYYACCVSSTVRCYCCRIQ
jgi:hypothetical protein